MESTGERRTTHIMERIHEQLDALERRFGELPDRELRGRLIDHLLQLRAECNREFVESRRSAAQPKIE